MLGVAIPVVGVTVTTSSTVHCLNNVHNLIYWTATPEQACLIQKPEYHAAVKTSIHTGNTKLHISNNTCSTSLQDTGLFNVTQHTDLCRRIVMS